jgi:hypothetical protein
MLSVLDRIFEQDTKENKLKEHGMQNKYLACMRVSDDKSANQNAQTTPLSRLVGPNLRDGLPQQRQ